MFPFGRLLVLYFSLVVPAICIFVLHICICFPSKINDDKCSMVKEVDCYVYVAEGSWHGWSTG